MHDHYFVSYSRNDAAEFAGNLADHLVAEDPPYRLWVDVRRLQPGQEDWDDQLALTYEDAAGPPSASAHSPPCGPYTAPAPSYRPLSSSGRPGQGCPKGIA
jgi:hypothetical protein